MQKKFQILVEKDLLNHLSLQLVYIFHMQIKITKDQCNHFASKLYFGFELKLFFIFIKNLKF